ncbi:MAG: hypothetical protein D6680_01480 [Cyanobacteria bacterium J007]|nr:MAG: hypothetical protein D6680_01480 [Cyanobacteria bacterium J007]
MLGYNFASLSLGAFRSTALHYRPSASFSFPGRSPRLRAAIALRHRAIADFLNLIYNFLIFVKRSIAVRFV